MLHIETILYYSSVGGRGREGGRERGEGEREGGREEGREGRDGRREGEREEGREGGRGGREGEREGGRERGEGRKEGGRERGREEKVDLRGGCVSTWRWVVSCLRFHTRLRACSRLVPE